MFHDVIKPGNRKCEESQKEISFVLKNHNMVYFSDPGDGEFT